MIRLFYIFILIFTLISNVLSDERISVVPYDANRVYIINAEIGKTSLIQFSSSESLTKDSASALGLGFDKAWNLGVRENNILLKPSYDRPNTNLIVVTNKRTYVFDLRIAPKNTKATYVLRFEYPEEERAAKIAEERAREIAFEIEAQKKAKLIEITEPARNKKVFINTNYYWRGTNEEIKPTATWDDGLFTYLLYDHSSEIPVFFKKLPDGTEALINTNINEKNKNIIVLQEVVKIVFARLGDSVIEIINNDYKTPQFNQTGSSEHGTVRIEKGELQNVK